MIRNATRKFTIMKRQKSAGSLLSQGIGLMFHRKPDYGLVFILGAEKRISLTNVFVFFPIDILFLDKEKRVVEIKKGFRPFTLNYTPKARFAYIIELPCGVLKKTAVGDRIHISGL
jgi:uncharacterized protein